jgi:hypothetical protein
LATGEVDVLGMGSVSWSRKAKKKNSGETRLGIRDEKRRKSFDEREQRRAPLFGEIALLGEMS